MIITGATGSWEGKVFETFVSFIDRNAYILEPVLIAIIMISLGYVLRILGEKTYHGARRAWSWTVNQIDPTIELLRRIPGKIMAKWKKSLVADIVFDALLEANIKGQIRNGDLKRLCGLLAVAFDVPDLRAKKLHKKAIMNALAKNKLAGPKNPIPGKPDPGPIDETYVPDLNVIPRSKFLQKLKEKEVKVA